MSKLYIGLMSGTSMDAVNAALVELHDDKLEVKDTCRHPLPDEIRGELLTLCSSETVPVGQLGKLDVQMGKLFASACVKLLEKNQLTAKQISAIGSHGQTIHHKPQTPYPFTIQIGDPNVISEETNITTVADFRRRDIAAGGQGAPLTPCFHQHAFRSAAQDRVIINLGGMANITILPADLSQPMIGFDTGPGNVLLDAWTFKNNGEKFDDEGQWASQGKVNHSLLDSLLSDSYFSMPPPKSTGREQFNLRWLETHLTNLDSPANPIDVQSTLVALTANSIAQAIQPYTKQESAIYLCGGGVKNSFLVEQIQSVLNGHTVHTTDSLGLPSDWVEAAAFAWLAHRTLKKETGNAIEITGATHASVLGGIYQA